jgi:hypothetical protein
MLLKLLLSSMNRAFLINVGFAMVKKNIELFQEILMASIMVKIWLTDKIISTVTRRIRQQKETSK